MLNLRPIVLLFCLVFLLLLGIWVVRYWIQSKDVTETVKDRIITWVKEETGGNYQIQISNLHIDPDKQSVLISELIFEPANSKLITGTTYKFRLENLLVNNIDISSFLESSLLELSNITIAGGEFVIYQGSGKANAILPANRNPAKQFSKKGLRAIKIDSIQLSQLDLIYTTGKKSTTKLESVHLDLYDFHTDSLAANAANPLPVGRFRLAIEQLKTDLADKKYALVANKVIVNGSKHIQAVIKGIELKPATGNSLEAIAAQSSVQKDVYQLRIPEVVIDSLDYRAFLEDSMIRTPLILLNSPTLEIFNDRSRPPATQSKIGKNPHQLLQQLIYGLDVPLLQIKNGAVTYYEKNKEGTATGKLRFTSITGNAGPVQKGVQTKARLELNLEAKLMEEIPMNAQFYFPPGKNGQFTVKAALQPFPLAILNPVIQPLARVKIRSGTSSQLQFTIDGNDQGAKGLVRFTYNDLKVDVLKEKNSGDITKRPLISLLANQLLLRTNNRSNDHKDHEFLVQEERDPVKSFFNLIWKTLFEGLKSSAGIRPKDAKPA